MQTRVRVVGSGFTTFKWRSQTIAFLDSVQDQGQAPIAPPEPIHPLDQRNPIEFATARAMSHGSFTFQIRELWNAPVWQQLVGLQGANDIVDVWSALAADPSSITCVMVIRPPQGGYLRTKTYHNVLVSDIDDSETISIGTLSIGRAVTCLYTHATRSTVPGS